MLCNNSFSSFLLNVNSLINYLEKRMEERKEERARKNERERRERKKERKEERQKERRKENKKETERKEKVGRKEAKVWDDFYPPYLLQQLMTLGAKEFKTSCNGHVTSEGRTRIC